MYKFFIRRPIVAIVIAIVTVLGGVVAMGSLPIAQFPEITPPEIQVSATYTGANSVAVEQSVATPLEQQINGVENMIYMKSINANDGTISLRVTFNVGTNLDMANVLVQNRVAQAQSSIPQEVQRLGINVKKSLSFPLIIISLKSPKGTYDSNFLSNYANININDAISRINGVGQVTLFGGSDYAIRVWINPERIATMGMTVKDIINAVKDQNVLTPAGQIGGPPAPPGQDFTYTVQTPGRLERPEEFADIVVRSNPDGTLVRIKDVARVEMGTQLYNAVGRLDRNPAAVIAIYQQPGSNALAVTEAVRSTMDQLARRFPQDLEYTVSLDTTRPITAGIEEIVHTLFEAVVLVILVVFIFLQNWRATLIPLLTVPVALVGTFAIFPMLGFSINTLSLLGLVLAIGIVVDDAIVVVEAVMHHIEHGMSPRDATLKAMDEVASPVIAISLILSAVFIPVAFMGGITGRLYQQFALTIAISVLLSAFNALTLSPALSAMLLRPGQQAKGLLGRFFGVFNRWFEATTQRYLGFTSGLITRMKRSLLFILLICGLTVILGKWVPTGFLPEEDQGYIMVNVQLPDAASLQRTDEVCKKVEAILAENPAIYSFNTITGYSMLSSAYSSNTGFFFITLKPWEERKKSAEHAAAVTQQLNRAFAQQVPEAIAIAFGPPAIPGLGTGSGFSMMLQDRSGGPPQFLAEQTQKFMAAARKRKEIGGLFSPYRASVPQVFVDIDRDKSLKMGIPYDDVKTTLGTDLGGSYVNDFNRFGRLYKVYVEADALFRSRVENIQQFFVRSNTKSMIPLSTLVRTSSISGPDFTNRFNLFRSAEVIGRPAPGYSSNQALTALEEVARDVLPPEMSYSWNAMSYQEKMAAGKGAVVFALAILLVFLILAAQYESWSLPFSVLLGTPFAIFGALFGLACCRYVNNVFAQIGFVTLIGLAAKNAILIVEFARAEQEKGKPIVEAALAASKLRLRPILMTAFAFILGVVPLVMASGAGAEARKVIGMAVMSGLLIATILGVCLVPVLFTMVEKLVHRKEQAA